MIRVVSVLMLSFLCFSLSTPILDTAKNTKNSKISIASGSVLKIKGKTNVSTFECQFDVTTFANAIPIKYTNEKDVLKFDKAALILPNTKFDCGGRAINKDFHKLLKTDEFPEIKIILKEIATSSLSENKVHATVDIVISNITKRYKMPIVISGQDKLNVNGKLPIDINDFNLEAPKKMLGMIKVLPVIEIDFSLKLQQH